MDPRKALKSSKFRESFEVDKYKVHTSVPSNYKNFHRVNKPIGSGSYSSVFIYETSDKENSIAVKEFIDDEDDEDFFQELRNFKILGYHQNLVKFLFAFKEFDISCIALEYCKNGALVGIYDHEIGKNYTEETVRNITFQICSGLRFMLSKGRLHRDIKPANILVKNYKPLHVVVADLNFSCNVENAYNKAGSLLYKSPENSMKRFRTKLNKNRRRVVTDKADIWSVGVICYELLASRNKPYSVSIEDYEKLKQTDQFGKRFERSIHVQAYDNKVEFLPYIQWSRVSKEAQILLSKILNFDPKDRPNYGQILEDDWMRLSFDNKKLEPLYDEELFLSKKEGIEHGKISNANTTFD